MKKEKEDSQYDDITNEMVSSSSVPEPPLGKMFIPAGVEEEPLFGVPDASPSIKTKETKEQIETVKAKKQEEVEEEELEEEVEEEEEEVVEPEKKEKEGVEEEISDLGEYESDVTKFVVDKLESRLGIKMDETIDSVDSIVDELAKIVEDNSKPEFADPEIEKLDTFVRNGGSLKDYFSAIIEGHLNLDNVDLEDEKTQRRIIKENLKNSGYSDKQIERKIERYEETGSLADEAEDALEVLKEYNKKNEEKLLREQENARAEAEKQQQKFVSNVQTVIKDIKNIRGIAISDKEKRDLYNYIFVPDREGYTRYQRDYASDIKHLVESAFFTMKGDALIERASNKGATETARSLKEKLAQKGKRTKKSGSLREDEVDALSLFSKQLGR